MTGQTFTAETATQFERYSEANAEVLHEACPECQAYIDWFTYKRWLAQGFQVQRGEHGTKLTILAERKDKEDPEKTYKAPWRTTVFCRHQVQPIEGGSDERTV